MSRAANVNRLNRLNERELELGIAGTSASWHAEFSASSTIFIGGLAPAHTERHILAIFEQYGTIIHVNLVRDAQTRESRQYAFAMYADARSAILAVDNLNAAVVDGVTLHVDHRTDYNIPQPSAAYDTTPPLTTDLSTPSEDSLAPSSTPAPVIRQVEAERKRELGVMQRLEDLRKRRRIEAATSAADSRVAANPERMSDILPERQTAHPNQLQQQHIEKERHSHDQTSRSDVVAALPARSSASRPVSSDERRKNRIEKERRKAHRAAIRQARQERRAQKSQQNR